MLHVQCTILYNVKAIISLKKRVEVIHYKKANPQEGTRQIASHYNCARTQIQGNLQHQHEILKEYESNAKEDKKCHRTTEYVDICKAVHKWYCLGRERNVPISGIMFQEEARILAGKLSNPDFFKVSNGWLDCFKRQHNLR